MPFSFCFRLSLMCLSILQGYKCKIPTPGPDLPCCWEVYTNPIPGNMKACWIQRKDQTSCDIAAYIFISKSDKQYCVDPEASWLPDRLKKRKKKTGKECEELHQSNKAP